jgi:hypothetical protein
MIHRLALCVVLVVLATAAPRPAGATIISTTVFDTVDTVEINNENNSVNLVVTGILTGGGVPRTMSFAFLNTQALAAAAALRCERFAVIAMSKPGKYQFAVGVSGSLGACKLILRTP